MHEEERILLRNVIKIRSFLITSDDPISKILLYLSYNKNICSNGIGGFSIDIHDLKTEFTDFNETRLNHVSGTPICWAIVYPRLSIWID